MLKTALVAALCLCAFACGTPCSRIAAGEAAANDKGSPCGTSANTNWDNAHVQRCEQGLSSCSADDQKAMDTYADCLQKLPTCASGQSLSWTVSRAACVQSLLNVSLNCANATR